MKKLFPVHPLAVEWSNGAHANTIPGIILIDPDLIEFAWPTNAASPIPVIKRLGKRSVPTGKVITEIAWTLHFKSGVKVTIPLNDWIGMQ